MLRKSDLALTLQLQRRKANGRSVGPNKDRNEPLCLLRELLLSERYKRILLKRGTSTGNEHGKRENEKNGNKTSVEPKPYR